MQFKNATLIIAAMGFTLATLTGCNAGRNQTNIELIQDMMEQPNLKSQEYDSVRDESAMRLPPENTVPRGFKPYRYSGQPQVAAAQLQNPYSNGASDAVKARGRQQFEIYCSICHGLKGAGDGNVAQYMPLRPPSLLSDKVRNLKDGQIFHIITDGQGVMSSYKTQVRSEDDRWAIVTYIRSLQRGN